MLAQRGNGFGRWPEFAQTHESRPVKGGSRDQQIVDY